jgi:hypothetical protein
MGRPDAYEISLEDLKAAIRVIEDALDRLEKLGEIFQEHARLGHTEGKS